MSIDISRALGPHPVADHRWRAGRILSPVTNKAHETDRLVAAASPVAGKIEIHGIKVVGTGIDHAAAGEGPRPAARHRDHAEAARLSPALSSSKAPLAKGDECR